MATQTQRDNLERIVEYSEAYYKEAEAAEYSDTGELWDIIKMFTGAARSIIEGKS